jgi:hypothetical protein
MLAAAEHLERWVIRKEDQDKALRQVFDAARFPYDADASSSITLWAYENAEKVQALVWVSRKGQTAKLTPGWQQWFM